MQYSYTLPPPFLPPSPFSPSLSILSLPPFSPSLPIYRCMHCIKTLRGRVFLTGLDHPIVHKLAILLMVLSEVVGQEEIAIEWRRRCTIYNPLNKSPVYVNPLNICFNPLSTEKQTLYVCIFLNPLTSNYLWARIFNTYIHFQCFFSFSVWSLVNFAMFFKQWQCFFNIVYTLLMHGLYHVCVSF